MANGTAKKPTAVKVTKANNDNANGNGNAVMIPAAIIVAGLIIAGAVIYSNGGVGLKTAGLGDTGGSTTPSPSPSGGSAVSVSEDNDPFTGDENAPVVMIEFSDFECPFCGRFFNETLSQVEEKYINTGKVKFVYRDFPLSFHPNAQKAAEAGECANEQGKFWEMHDMIFENQSAIAVANLKTYAANLGLNTGQFNSCLDSGKYADEVASDVADGTAAGVSGTPTFFINGQILVGAQPFSAFEQVIEAELQ